MFRSTTFLLASLFIAAGARSAADAPVPLEPLRQEDIAPGCRCSFSLQPQSDPTVPAVFALDLASGEGLVRIDGTLVRLTRMSSKDVKKHERRDSVGDRHTETWASGSTELTFKYKTAFVCPEAYSTCARTDYEGQITFTNGSTKQPLAVWGSCWCPSGA